MSSLERKVDRLIRATHVYTSHEELCLFRDYIVERLAELPKPKDMEERLKRLRDLEGCSLDGNDDIIEEAHEIIAEDEAIHLAYVLPALKARCDDWPNGIWEPIHQVHYMPATIAAARNYLSESRRRKAKRTSKAGQGGDRAPSQGPTA